MDGPATILVTSADIKKIEHDRSMVESEIAVSEAKLRRLRDRGEALDERLARISLLIEIVDGGSPRPRVTH